MLDISLFHYFYERASDVSFNSVARTVISSRTVGIVTFKTIDCDYFGYHISDDHACEYLKCSATTAQYCCRLLSGALRGKHLGIFGL